MLEANPDHSTNAAGPARWSIAGRLLEGLGARDFEIMASTLRPDVRFRALLPGGPSEWHGRDDTLDTYRSWFGGAEHFEVIDATVGEVARRLQVTYRIRLRPAPFDIGDGWHVIEQHAFLDATHAVEAIDLVCSGFRADPAS